MSLVQKAIKQVKKKQMKTVKQTLTKGLKQRPVNQLVFRYSVDTGQQPSKNTEHSNTLITPK